MQPLAAEVGTPFYRGEERLEVGMGGIGRAVDLAAQATKEAIIELRERVEDRANRLEKLLGQILTALCGILVVAASMTWKVRWR